MGVSAAASTPFVPAFSFTPEERRYQDRRLQSVIANAWREEGGVVWWRSQPEVKEFHQQRARFYKVEGTHAWADYIEVVLAMTWAATGYFVPIDFWPFVPPPATLDRTGRLGFEVVLNTQREAAGVFSPDSLRANKHYALLLAHLIWCPDPIHDAANLIAPPYPWPVVLVKRDAAETFRLERQEDIDDSQWEVAERCERQLFREAKQTRAYGVSAAAAGRRQDMQEKMAHVNRATGRAITRAYDAFLASEKPPRDIIGAIMRDPAVEDAYSLDGVKIPLTPRKIRELHKADCLARGLTLPRPGRPSKRASAG